VSSGKSEDFLHLTSGASSAAHVRLALKKVGRSERVVHASDALGVGPLAGIDNSSKSRVAWWSKLEGRKLTAEDARRIDESSLWASLRHSKRVVVWHGAFPGERLVALRLCWHLRRQPERVYEVKLPPHKSAYLPAFYCAVGIVGTDALADAWSSHRRVRDVAGRANRWAALRARRGEWIRHLAGDRVLELPITAYDGPLIRACGESWRSSSTVIGTVLADAPSGDAILRWRVRSLLDSGRLEGRGRESRLGLPNEIRAAVALAG
jgi:hypothetical protein